MLYVFTGTSEYEVKLQTQKWKKLFAEKHGDFNITHVKNLGDVNVSFLAESLLSNSLFESKKMIILEIDPNERKTTELEKKYEYIIRSAPNISSESIVVICYPKPDKRSRFYKETTKVADKVQVFDEKKSHDLVMEIEKKYGENITRGAISLLCRYKGENYQKIVSEIEKLLITLPKIEESHIQKWISPELEESIFTLVDAILSQNKKLALESLRIISEDTNIYLLYNSLIANIRTTYYIGLLKYKKIPLQMIRDELKLGKRGFLVDKSYNMSFENISFLYHDMISIDRNMKTGQLLGSDDKDFVFELERILYKYL